MQPHNIPATNGHDTWSTPGPSRAINVTTLRPEVEALCAKHKATISAIESLPNGGGTRVVLMLPLAGASHASAQPVAADSLA